MKTQHTPGQYADAAGQKRLMRESVGQPADLDSRQIQIVAGADYGADPIGDGMFRLIPSGRIVTKAEKDKALKG